MRKWFVVAAILVAACGGSSDGETASTVDGPVLVVEGRSFGQPPSVVGGESFTIENRDPGRHTFSSNDGSWQEVALPGGSKVEFTADLEPGTYQFFCAVHPDSMGGTLTVGG